MTMLFSPATGGFYDRKLHRNPPSDAIDITAAAHQALLDAQAEGKIIALVEGKVRAIDPPPPTAGERLAIARMKRNRLLAATDRLLAVPDFPLSAARRQEITAWRDALRRMTEATDPSAELARLIGPARPDWIDNNGAIAAVENM